MASQAAPTEEVVVDVNVDCITAFHILLHEHPRMVAVSIKQGSSQLAAKAGHVKVGRRTGP